LSEIEGLVVVASARELSEYSNTYKVQIPQVDFGDESILFVHAKDTCADAKLVSLVIHNKTPIVFELKNKYRVKGGELVCDDGAAVTFIAFIVVPNEYL